MASPPSPPERKRRSRRRWAWLPLLLALLLSFGCVFCSTWWALWWPDRLAPASLLAQQQANYRRGSADEVKFAILDPNVGAQAATDIARLHLTPTQLEDNPADPSFVIGFLPATPTPTPRPGALPLPQTTNTPGSVSPPATLAPSPLATVNSTATSVSPASATAAIPAQTVTAPANTPTPLAAATSTPASTQTPAATSPTPPPLPTATSVPPTSPPSAPTSPPKPKPTSTPTPAPTLTPTSTATATATPTNTTTATDTPTGTATSTSTPTDTVTPTATNTSTATPLPAGFVLALCGTGISVDGNLNEAAWSGSSTSVSKVVLGGPALVTANYLVRWDTTYMYIGIDVVDSAIYADSNPSYWDDDAVEMFFDINNNHSTTYQADDLQFIVGWSDPSQYFLKNLTGGYYSNGTSGVSFALTSTATGYSVEVAIPWSRLGTTPSGGNVYGFDLGVDGDQDGGNREVQMMWQGTANNYLDTSAFGQLLLDNCTP